MYVINQVTIDGVSTIPGLVFDDLEDAQACCDESELGFQVPFWDPEAARADLLQRVWDLEDERDELQAQVLDKWQETYLPEPTKPEPVQPTKPEPVQPTLIIPETHREPYWKRLGNALLEFLMAF